MLVSLGKVDPLIDADPFPDHSTDPNGSEKRGDADLSAGNDIPSVINQERVPGWTKVIYQLRICGDLNRHLRSAPARRTWSGRQRPASPRSSPLSTLSGHLDGRLITSAFARFLPTMVTAENNLFPIIALHLSHPPDTNALAMESHTAVFSLQTHHSSILGLVRHLLPASGRVPTRSCRHLELIDRCLGSCGIYLGLLSAVSMTVPLSSAERKTIHNKLEQWVAIVEWCDAMTSLLECWGCGSAQVCDMQQWKEKLLQQSGDAEVSLRRATRVERSDGERRWCEVRN